MRKILWLLLLIVFIAFIFYNSCMPASESHSASKLVGTIITGMGKWFGIDMPQSNLDHNIRKLAHFLEFVVLGLILCNMYAAFGINRRMATGYILFLGLAVAVTDEYIQLHSPGRSGLVTDIVLDFSGVFFVWLTLEVWRWSKQR